MATSQIPNNDPEKGVKEEQNVSQEDIKTMVKFLKQNTKYKILTEEEYANLTHSLVDQDDQGIPRMASSTPKPYKMAPNVPRIDHLLMFYNSPPNNSISFSHPKIPVFTGEEKSEISFEVWKFEVKCILKEKNYSMPVILQAIRNSLKGKARGLLLSLSEEATPDDIIEKLEGVYGNVYDCETIMQNFYMQRQELHQTVAEYGIKLETILQSAVEKGHISPDARNDMLRTKFWSGLRDTELKNASRYKYDTTENFDTLRKEIRAIELEISNSKSRPSETPTSNTKVRHNPLTTSTTTSDSVLDNILKKIEKMDQKMNTFEQTLSKINQQRGDNSNRGGRNHGHFKYRGNRNYNRGRFDSQQTNFDDREQQQPMEYGNQPGYFNQGFSPKDNSSYRGNRGFRKGRGTSNSGNSYTEKRKN